MKSIYTIALVASLFTAAAASAEILVDYGTVATPPGATSVSNSAPGVTYLTTSDLTASAELSANIVNQRFVPQGWTQPTPASALASGEYITFNIGIDPEKQLNLATLDMFFSVQADPENTPDWAIYSSIDSFANPVASGTDLIGGTYISASIDVSGTAFDTVTGNLEFRICMADVKNEWFWAGVSSDNNDAGWPKPSAITLTGTVEDKVDPIVPELIVPATVVDSTKVYNMVIQTEDGFPSTLYPVSKANLTTDPWGSIAHSASPFGPFMVTNLAYSTIVDGDYSIYIELHDATKRAFFNIEYID